jgi:hypothetical protein
MAEPTDARSKESNSVGLGPKRRHKISAAQGKYVNNLVRKTYLFWRRSNNS